jgi:diguanylate cyclase (GGDEF)-like protein
MIQSIPLWWQKLGLQLRLHVLIQGCLIVILVATQFWLSKQFENQVLADAQDQAQEVADGVINGLNTLMVIRTDQGLVISDKEARALFIQKLGATEKIKELRIIRAKQIDTEYPEGLPQEQAVDDMDRSVLASGKIENRMFRSGDKTWLRTVVPFIAKKDFRTINCLHCHRVQEGAILGAASVTVDIHSDIDFINNISSRIWVGQFMLQVILYIAIGLIVRRLAKQLGGDPDYVIDIVKQIAKGNLSQEISTQDGDSTSILVAVKQMQKQRKLAEEQISNLAFYDSLTLLPNRRLFLDRLRQSLVSSTRVEGYGALLFIDLDNFKTLNDNFGHQIGDLLLQQVAQRLVLCVRDSDTVSRLGGDEFVVMLDHLSVDAVEAARQAETVGEKIRDIVNQPFRLDKYVHHSSCSIGVTLFNDQQANVDELLKRADLAMYRAKDAGRNTLSFFDPEMQAVVTTRAALEADLREAIPKGQLLLYYQAQVVDPRRYTGAEVLVRWEHPERGMVAPSEFIPLAEDTGLILEIGLWVLETACNQLAVWATQPKMAHLTVAVNVSAHQFRLANFVELVLTVLEQTGANPHRLKLELTESLLVKDVEDIIAKMTALKHKGVSFSLDDFGTGYSSLSCLKRLPLDQLKIDQSFVRDILTDPNDAAIAKMVIVLAESMGLVVIAEGVELEEQCRFLASQGCHAYQGYLFSRPLPLAAFEALIGRV